jgi:alpha(1,3/1,4) fucosyltransferase
MRRVLVRPPFQDWCQNRLFSQGTSFQRLYREAFARWRTLAHQNSFQIDTWDCAPIEEADVFWFLDLPQARREFFRIRSRLKPEAKLVLQVLESPALAFHAFRPENMRYFNAVGTYEPNDVSSGIPRRFHYLLPNTFRAPSADPPFEKRKGLLVLNSNRVEGYWAIRQPGWAGLPLFGKLFAGWHCGVSDLMEYLHGELYSARRALVRTAEQCAPDFVDLYGPGWNGEQVSWCPLYPNRSYRCWRGVAQGHKDELAGQYRFLLAFENFRGRRGYISEKIFDAFCAGSVPVYLGEERIRDFVPKGAFVDARAFSTHRELLGYLQSCPEHEWQAMREAGQAFLRSEAAFAFTDGAFAERMMELLREVSD